MASADLSVATDAPSASAAELPAPPPRPVYGDAYVTHFTLVLRTIVRERPDFRRLYSARELALAEHFLDRLAPLEQHVYARLFQRKGPWFKTSSLLSYFTRRPRNDSKAVEDSAKAEETEDADAVETAADQSANSEAPEPEAESVLGFLPEVADHRQVQTTIQTLVNAGLLLTPTLVSPVFMSSQDQDAQLLLALEAIQRSATSAELTALWKKLSGGKTKVSNGGGVRSSGASSTLQSGKNSNGGSINATGNGTNKGEVFQAIKRLVMSQRRVDGSRIPVAKMMHSIWLDSYPLLQQRNSKDDIILVVRLSDAARELFSRMHRLFYFQAAMPSSSSPVTMPASARIKSFQQIIIEKSGASRNGLDALTYAGSGSLVQQWPGLLVIFKKARYPNYEINIRHPIFSSAESYICYEIASRLHRLVNSLELEMILDQVAKDEDVLPSNWIFSDDIFENIPGLVAFQRLVLPPSENAGRDEWQGHACVQFEELLEEWTSLDELVLEARRCLRAYNHYFSKQTTPSEDKDDPPVFYIKCNAGYHLSRVLHHASALYEKKRQYARAVALLRDLLSSPVFLVRKRAHWYERLALNYEHLKQYVDAKEVCEQALKDPDVLGAGQLAIQRRFDRLTKRKGMKSDTGGPPIIITVDKPSGSQTIDKNDIIDLLSSDEDEDALPSEGTGVADGQRGSNGDKNRVYESHSGETVAAEYEQHYIVGRPLNKNTGEKSRFIGYDDEPCDVEQLVLQYYHSQTGEVYTSGGGWYGVHCEGRVLVNVFGLLMWDILYAPVPDVFQSAYQAGPLDFGFARAFYGARRDQIDQLVHDIEHKMTTEEVLSKVEEAWIAHEGEITRFIGWGGDSTLRFHQLVVAAIGKRSLAKLLLHMATSEEFHRAQNGLPDLLLVRACLTEDIDERWRGVCMDKQHPRALDVYKFCDMNYSTNLNKTEVGLGSNVGSAGVELQSDSNLSHGDARIGTSVPLEVTELARDGAPWQLELKLVEVKGPRDRLSDQQVRWLQLLNGDFEIDASVMHVVEDEKEIEKRQQKRANTNGKSPSKRTTGSKSKASDCVERATKRSRKS